MEFIIHLAEMALEEAEGAEKYAKMALEQKEVNPELAQDLYNIASQELGHEEVLYKHAWAMTQRADNPAVTSVMNYLRKHIMTADVSAKTFLEQLKR